MVTKKMHSDEFDINELLVKNLINSQFPDWADLPIKQVSSSGTDNAIFRLGNTMCIRLPRVERAAKHIESQYAWLSKLVPSLPLAVPMPLALGNPDNVYPWHWSVCSWVEGTNAYVAPPANVNQAAIDMAEFLRVLQSIDIEDVPLSRRGVPLIVQDEPVRNALRSLDGVIDTKKADVVWQECLQAPLWDKPSVWVHGDLLPSNIVTHNGCITGIIDFDFLGSGDPACDLIVAWALLSSDSRTIFRDILKVDDATWMRGRGWALSIALIILPYYKDTNLELVNVAKRMLHEILSE